MILNFRNYLPFHFYGAIKAFCVFIILGCCSVNAQSAWPSETWSSAVNLTPVMSAAGLTELSGLHWNPVKNRLYVTHGDGRLHVLQLDTVTAIFTQIADKTGLTGSEGVTQANLNANEFYTIDEDNYYIRKYTHPSDFSSITLSKSWNIVAAPSTMTNTGNDGPEGITFVPDSFLNAAGFISQATGNAYTSTKGMGGLLFIAHQNLGNVWVFDVNPNVSNDFALVGKYQTNKSESCDIGFDRSTGLLYILHNTGVNTLEVNNLTSTAVSAGQRKLVTLKEYSLANPSGNINVEGFAISSRCPDSTNTHVWLCRDVESVESSSYKQDCLRWFSPFTSDGICMSSVVLSVEFISFNAEMKNPVIELKWLTASEKNNDYFSVEKSIDGEEWNVISILNGAGNSNHTIAYSTNDMQPYHGIQYYRIRQTDYDGKNSLSGTISAKFDADKKQQLFVYCDLNKKDILFSVSGEELQNAALKITDLSGKNIFQKDNLTGNKFSFELPDCARGIYLIHLYECDKILSAKMFIN